MGQEYSIMFANSDEMEHCIE